MTKDNDRTRVLNAHNLLLYASPGEASGDATQFAEFIQANIQLDGMRDETELNSAAVASFTRRALADALRSRVSFNWPLFFNLILQKAYTVSLLLAGYNIQTSAPSLYWTDYIAASTKVPFAAHGYGAYYCMSIFDRYHRMDLSEDEAIDILKKCFAEIELRMPIDVKGFDVKKIDAEGISKLSL